jgi:SagB-type dehydrogenase family enzyme
MRVRTSPGATVIIMENRTIILNSDESTEFELGAASLGKLADILSRWAKWTSFERAAGELQTSMSVEAVRAEATLLDLVNKGIIELADDSDREMPFEDQGTWNGYNWLDAYRYHRHLRSLPKIDYSTRDGFEQDVSAMRDIVASEDQPEPYLCRAGIDSVALCARLGGTTFDGPILDTVTHVPESQDEQLSPASFEWLVQICFGQTGVRRLPVTGTHVVKTSPSGGSRHPTEIYPIVLPGEYLDAGLYHYNVKGHRLDTLMVGDLSDFVRNEIIALRGRPGFRPRVVFVLASVAERSMYRYRQAHSYRVLFQDVGHVLQTFAYAGSALGRCTYRGYTLHVSPVAKLLGINMFEQIPLAFGVLG